MKNLKEIGIGSFRPGREPQGRHVRSVDLMGPSSNADSVISQRSQYNVGNYSYDEDYDDEVDDLQDTVLECRVYRNGKYCLVETLEKVNEFDYADKFAAMNKKINNSSREKLDSINDLPDLEDMIDEFSGSAAIGGGPAVPLGYTAKGKPETPAQRRKRQRFNITKSYPYTQLANPPKSSKKRRK